MKTVVSASAKLWAIVVAVLCLCGAGLLVGCSGSDEADEQTQNRQYMSSVNQIMETLDENMSEFSFAVKEGEVVSLSAQLSAVNDAVDSLNSLEVPEAMEEIHEAYVEGATELQTALATYVDLYEEVKAPESGSYDYSGYDDTLEEIQAHYDAGITALEQADELAENA